MAAGRYDIQIEQGSDFELYITYKDTDGNNINMNQYGLARMQIRENTEGPILLELRSDSPANPESYVAPESLITLGNSDPNFRIFVENSITESLNFDTAFYDLELVGQTGSVTKILRGSVKLIKEFTK